VLLEVYPSRLLTPGGRSSSSLDPSPASPHGPFAAEFWAATATVLAGVAPASGWTSVALAGGGSWTS